MTPADFTVTGDEHHPFYCTAGQILQLHLLLGAVLLVLPPFVPLDLTFQLQ